MYTKLSYTTDYVIVRLDFCLQYIYIQFQLHVKHCVLTLLLYSQCYNVMLFMIVMVHHIHDSSINNYNTSIPASSCTCSSLLPTMITAANEAL